MTRLTVDAQHRPKEPPISVDILDSVGLDRRMTPQPLVFELSSLEAFYAAGGEWIPTVPMALGEND